MEKKKKWLKMRIKAMQRYGQSGDILFLLTSTDDMAGLMRRWRYLERISFRERKGIEEYGEEPEETGRERENGCRPSVRS